VVLKSIFEEDIVAEHEEALREATARGFNRMDYDYYDYEIRGERLAEYAALVREAKRGAGIPVIASVNCAYSHEWVHYARGIEEAGADALELNLFFLPSDLRRTPEEIERQYFTVVERVRAAVRIPLALKISPHFTGLARMIRRLSETGAQGLVLFNRFAPLDFDVEAMALSRAGSLSSPAEMETPLRWIALMARRVSCDLCASTGVHDGLSVVKQLLAGAKAVQVVSALYRAGAGRLKEMLAEVEAWMDRHGFADTAAFRGRLSQAASEDPAAFERVQFLKRYGR
jgi:dihydroorotate dehydrogenase (fumarate)